MEERKQRSFSTILMLVGVLFIAVSGGIFVSKTWQYLPETIKKVCLLAVTGGLFFGSDFAEKQSGLRKTSAALYYLGVCFTGFTIISLLGMFQLHTSFKLSLAMLGMTIPVAAHFFRKLSILDSIFELILLDGITVCVSSYAIDDAARLTILTGSVVTLLLSAFIRYCKNCLPEEKGLLCGATIFYGIHAALLFPACLVSTAEKSSFLFMVLPSVMFTASLSLLYRTYRAKALRILESLSLFFLHYAAVNYVVRSFFNNILRHPFDAIVFFTLLCSLCAAIALNRTEMMLSCSIIAILSSLGQLVNYVLYNCFDKTYDSYFPYTFCMAAALLLFVYIRKSAAKNILTKYSVSLFVMELNVLAAFISKQYCSDYSLAFWFAILALQAAILCHRSKLLQSVFETIAMAFSLGALISQPAIPTEFYMPVSGICADFSVEYNCILMELGVVLLGFIWYYNKKTVHLFQFIATCILLAVLVCNNLAIQSLPNVLFLGITTLILLIAATALKKRNYAIAAAATLILVVFYLTRAVWMSITWWVYLFAAGVFLVVYAIRREKAE